MINISTYGECRQDMMSNDSLAALTEALYPAILYPHSVICLIDI
jgi:hypothetical protein